MKRRCFEMKYFVNSSNRLSIVQFRKYMISLTLEAISSLTLLVRTCLLLTWKAIFVCLLQFAPQSRELIAILKSSFAKESQCVSYKKVLFASVSQIATSCFLALDSWESTGQPIAEAHHLLSDLNSIIVSYFWI